MHRPTEWSRPGFTADLRGSRDPAFADRAQRAVHEDSLAFRAVAGLAGVPVLRRLVGAVGGGAADRRTAVLQSPLYRRLDRVREGAAYDRIWRRGLRPLVPRGPVPAAAADVPAAVEAGAPAAAPVAPGPAASRRIDAAIAVLRSVPFEEIQRRGWHFQPNHFYWPLNDVAFLRENLDLWHDRGLPRGIDWDIDAQVELARTLGAYADELADVPWEPDRPPTRYAWSNGAFGGADAHAYYGLVRRLKPRRVVEVGSGWSSLLLARALERNGTPTDVTLIEPFPDADLFAALPPEWRVERGHRPARAAADLRAPGSGRRLLLRRLALRPHGRRRHVVLLRGALAARAGRLDPRPRHLLPRRLPRRVDLRRGPELERAVPPAGVPHGQRRLPRPALHAPPPPPSPRRDRRAAGARRRQRLAREGLEDLRAERLARGAERDARALDRAGPQLADAPDSRECREPGAAQVRGAEVASRDREVRRRLGALARRAAVDGGEPVAAGVPRAERVVDLEDDVERRGVRPGGEGGGHVDQADPEVLRDRQPRQLRAHHGNVDGYALYAVKHGWEDGPDGRARQRDVGVPARPGPRAGRRVADRAARRAVRRAGATLRPRRVARRRCGASPWH